MPLRALRLVSPLAAAVLVAAVLLAAVVAGCGGEADPAAPASAAASGASSAPDRLTLSDQQLGALTLATVAVEKAPVTSYLQLPARVEAAPDQAALATSLVAGRIEAVLVSAGDPVRRGQTVARIAAPGLSDRVAALRAARDELDRQERLQARGVAVTKHVRAAERGYQAARQRLAALGLPAARIAAVAAGTDDLATLPLAAPLAGTVVERMATLGAPVRAGEALLRIAALRPVVVVADVYEQHLGQVAEGQAVEVTTALDPGRRYEGAVARLVPQVDAERRAAQARIVLPNDDRRLRPGMFATVRVAVVGPPQPVLPADALLTDAQGAYVVLDEGRTEDDQGRTFRRVYVDADPGADGTVAVPSLDPGTRVVTQGAFQIASQMDAG